MSASKGTSPKKSSSKGTSPKEDTSKGTSPKEGTSKGTSSKEGTSKGMSAKEGTSRLERIDVPADNPFRLFSDWLAEAQAGGLIQSSTMVLTTANAKLESSARALVVRRVDPNGFVFITDSRSRKCADLAVNPTASALFLWMYPGSDGRDVNRQVRAGGFVEELPREQVQEMYDSEPLHCRLRSHLCLQGCVVEWEEVKRRHDDLLLAHEKGRLDITLMPDHLVGYKLVVQWMEFYSAHSDTIADRVHFRLCDDVWSHGHLYA